MKSIAFYSTSSWQQSLMQDTPKKQPTYSVCSDQVTSLQYKNSTFVEGSRAQPLPGPARLWPGPSCTTGCCCWSCPADRRERALPSPGPAPLPCPQSVTQSHNQPTNPARVYLGRGAPALHWHGVQQGRDNVGVVVSGVTGPQVEEEVDPDQVDIVQTLPAPCTVNFANLFCFVNSSVEWP